MGCSPSKEKSTEAVEPKTEEELPAKDPSETGEGETKEEAAEEPQEAEEHNGGWPEVPSMPHDYYYPDNSWLAGNEPHQLLSDENANACYIM